MSRYHHLKNYLNTSDCVEFNNFVNKNVIKFAYSIDSDFLNKLPKMEDTYYKILKFAKGILEEFSYDIDDSKFFIECWSFKLTGGDISTPLTKHKDDYGAVDYKVETCIIYTEKTIDGGNLLIEDKEYHIQTGDIVLLGGDSRKI